VGASHFGLFFDPFGRPRLRLLLPPNGRLRLLTFFSRTDSVAVSRACKRSEAFPLVGSLIGASVKSSASQSVRPIRRSRQPTHSTSWPGRCCQLLRRLRAPHHASSQMVSRTMYHSPAVLQPSPQSQQRVTMMGAFMVVTSHVLH